MEIRFPLLLGFLLVLLAVDGSHGADSKVPPIQNLDLDPKTPDVSVHGHPNEINSGSESGSLKSDQGKKDEDRVVESKGDVENTSGKSNSTKELESEEAHNEQTGKGISNSESQTNGDNKKGDKPGQEIESKQVTKKEGNERVSKSSKAGKTESIQGEECDSSNQCSDDINKFVACLRVPGDESPDLFLLIQNKGKSAVAITISAPDFVELENRKVDVQEKNNIKVKISMRNGGGSDNSIVLTAGKGRCNLDLKDLITAQNSQKRTDDIPKSTDNSFLPPTSSLAFLFLIALVAAASTWICISFKKKYFPSNGAKYQKLDMPLPVSGSTKAEAEPDINDGWDNSWGDNWDDEEAPKTPSMPLTPSLSSRGLASRRLSKEGWKD